MKEGTAAGAGSAWGLAIAIWLAGAAILAALWEWHPRSQVLDVLLGTLLYIVAFFYFLALAPLHEWAARWLNHRSEKRRQPGQPGQP